MPVALDLGTHVCRSLRRRVSELAARRCRSVVTWLADGELPRAWLERLHIPYFPCEDHLALPGDHAEELSRLFPVPIQDLLIDDRIPYGDPVSRQLIAAIVESLLPPATIDGDICCFTQPGFRQTIGEPNAGFERRLEFVSRLIRLRGYEAVPVNPAAALALAEMEPQQFTGLAVCLGAAGGDVALVHRGNPAAAIRLDKGGRWLDEQLARERNRRQIDFSGQPVLDVEGVRRQRETASLEGPADDTRESLTRLYRQLAADIASAIDRVVNGHPLLVKFAQPLAIVLGGGVARMPGFDSLVQTEIAERLAPGIVGPIRCAGTDEYAVARGLLIHATLVLQSRSRPKQIPA